MRDVPHIWEAWKSKAYVGDNKATCRVTVEKAYHLRMTESVLGPWSRGPARWFQREFPDQVGPTARNRPQIETELPNVMSVRTDEGLDSDVATCEITIANMMMPTLGEEPELEGQFGRPGYFSWSRGESAEARARWGQAPNAWSRALTPNALIRVYEGFGGEEKTVKQALADGNIVLKGTYLADKPRAGTSGTLTIPCRGMGKLLLEQPLYPPLVPWSLYPLHYQRYTYETYKIPEEPVPARGKIINHPVSFAPPVPVVPMSSSDGEWGHVREHVLDGDSNSYWLSEGKGGAGDAVWLEFYTYGKPVNQLYVHTWGGNYAMYVSIFENGEWVAPEESVEGGLAPGSGVPFVKRYTNQWEKPEELGLPRHYSAERIRLTFTNLTPSQEGGYRAGLRTFRAQENRLFAEYPVYVFTSSAMPYNEENIEGYWQARSNGKVYAFGDARVYPKSSDIGYGVPSDHQYAVVGMAAHSSGLGYWTVDMKGRVCAYGEAQYYGDLANQPGFAVVDIAPYPGGGYWLLEKDGTVHSFGNAPDLGNATVSGLMPSGGQIIARSIESLGDGDGYWVLRSDGNVQDFGDAVHYGNANRTGFTPTEYVASIRRTSTGEGYWIPSGNGKVQAFGDAPHLGNGFPYPPEQWAASLCWDFIPWSGGDDGYAIQHADGKLDVFGDFGYYGSIKEGEGQLRKDGNYKDYADIISELLLWSGFYFYRYPAAAQKPAVYGNIESTGAYSKLPLPDEMFDKRPVIEAITEIKEIVGYAFWIDEEGAARFESPNWWTPGNFDQNGQALDFIPEIDEQIQLTDFSTEISDTDARSEITLASAAPTANYKDTITTTIVPPGAELLKGMVKPAIWANGNFDDPEEQQTMAELIAMHIWMSLRQSSVTCVGNPLIGINDQVRIWERQTSETYISYVRGISTMWDRASGNYEMTLTVNWLGGAPTGDLPLFYAAAMTPDGLGYFQAASNGSVYAFGSAELQDPVEADDFHTEDVVSIRVTSTGLGYWTIDASGHIIAHGDAEHLGDLQRPDLDVVDMAVNATGDGYWVLLDNGGVWEFGEATAHVTPVWGGTLWNGKSIDAVAIEAHPTEDGYWLLYNDGMVIGGGDGTFTNAAPSIDAGAKADYYQTLRSNAEGTGVYVVTRQGRVTGLGTGVPDFGDAELYPADDVTYGEVWAVMPSRFPGDQGYALQHADGQLDFFADFPYEGAVGANSAYTGRARKPGWSFVDEKAITNLPERDTGNVVPVSKRVIDLLKRSGSPSAAAAIANGFGQPEQPTLKAAT